MMNSRYLLIGAACALAALCAATTAEEAAAAAHEDFVPLEVDAAKAMLGHRKQPTKKPFEHKKVESRKSLRPMTGFEGKRIRLQCPQSHGAKQPAFISVKAAMYKGNKCQAKLTKEVVGALCDNRKECSFTVRDDMFTNDGCKGEQRLTVVYSCDMYNEYDAAIGKPFRASCGTSGRIFIQYARYSVGEKVLPPRNPGCVPRGSLEIVRAKCQGKTDCNVARNNLVFGPECIDKKGALVPRRLQVLWKCTQQIDRPPIYGPPKHHKGYRSGYNRGYSPQGGYNQGYGQGGYNQGYNQGPYGGNQGRGYGQGGYDQGGYGQYGGPQYGGH